MFCMSFIIWESRWETYQFKRKLYLQCKLKEKYGDILSCFDPFECVQPVLLRPTAPTHLLASMKSSRRVHRVQCN